MLRPLDGIYPSSHFDLESTKRSLAQKATIGLYIGHGDDIRFDERSSATRNELIEAILDLDIGHYVLHQNIDLERPSKMLLEAIFGLYVGLYSTTSL